MFVMTRRLPCTFRLCAAGLLVVLPGMASQITSQLATAHHAESARIQAAALRGWTLLLSALPAWELTAADVERHLASLARKLESDGALLFHVLNVKTCRLIARRVRRAVLILRVCSRPATHGTSLQADFFLSR